MRPWQGIENKQSPISIHKFRFLGSILPDIFSIELLSFHQLSEFPEFPPFLFLQIICNRFNMLNSKNFLDCFWVTSLTEENWCYTLNLKWTVRSIRECTKRLFYTTCSFLWYDWESQLRITIENLKKISTALNKLILRVLASHDGVYDEMNFKSLVNRLQIGWLKWSAFRLKRLAVLNSMSALVRANWPVQID